MPTIPARNIGDVGAPAQATPTFQSAGRGGVADISLAQANLGFAKQTQAQADQLHNQIMDDLQQEAETIAKEGTAAVHNRRTKVLFGDPDDPTAPPGHNQLQGAERLANGPNARALLDAADQEIRAELAGNPEALRIYNDRMLVNNAQLERDMGLQDMRARKIAANDADAATDAQALSDAALHYADDERGARLERIMSSTAYNRAVRGGATHEAALIDEQQARASVVTARVKEAMAQGDNAAANRILAAATDPLAVDPQGHPLYDQTMMTPLRASLNVSNEKAAIGEAVSRISAAAPGDLKAQFKLVEELPSAQREPARQHLRRMDNDRDEAERETLEKAGGDAMEAMDDGASYEQWAATNPDEASVIDRNPTWSKAIQAKRKLLAEGRLFAEFTDGVSFVTLSRAVAEGTVLSEAQLDASRGLLKVEQHAQLNSLNNALIARNAAAAGKTGDKKDKLIAASDLAVTAVAPISLHGAAHNVAVKGLVFEWAQQWREDHNGTPPDQQQMRDRGAEVSIELNSDPDGFWTSDVRSIDPVTAAMINLRDLSKEQLRDLRVLPADLDGTVAGRRLRRKTEAMLAENGIVATEDNTQRLAAAIAVDNQQMINLILGK